MKYLTMTNEILDLTEWLSRIHKVKVPRDWLEACIDWLRSEQQVPLPRSALKDLLYQQWLLSDLHELEYATLPEGLSQQLKTHLNGSYALQADSVLDVGCSYYSQIQNKRGIELTQVTDNFQDHPPPVSRLLKVELTDGVQNIQGIEFEPIPAFRKDLKPGVKVLIEGNVICRRGILLLRPANVRVLGGEVDTLVENEQARLQGALELKLAGEFELPPAVTAANDSGLGPSLTGMSNARSQSTSYSGSSQRPAQTNQSLSIGSVARTQSLPSASARLVASIQPIRFDGDNYEHQTSSGQSTSRGIHSVASSTVSRGSEQSVNGSTSRIAATTHGFNHNIQNGVADDGQRLPNSQSDIDFEDDEDLDEFLLAAEEQSLNEMGGGGRPSQEEEERKPQVGREEEEWDELMEIADEVCVETRVQDKLAVRQPGLECSPFTYLSKVLRSTEFDGRTVPIKAYIASLITRLETNKGQMWSLAVTINDGTASLDVDLSNEVLASLIGFTSQEASYCE